MDTVGPSGKGNSQTKVTGDIVRDAYYELTSFFYPHSRKRVARWDGGYDFHGKYHERIWDKIAKFLNDKRCDDVYGFIRANILVYFNECYPNKLLSERAWENYRSYLSSISQEVKFHVKSQLDIFFSNVKFHSSVLGDKAVESVILNKSNDFSPIIRCYLVWKFGISPLKLPESIWRSARLQYLTAKGIYDSLLPELKEIFPVKSQKE